MRLIPCIWHLYDSDTLTKANLVIIGLKLYLMVADGPTGMGGEELRA